jgi:hypothetical protein
VTGGRPAVLDVTVGAVDPIVMSVEVVERDVVTGAV